ncbi:MAG: glycosyltransferase family 4 protein [Bacteroidota bacterium]
MKILTVVRDLNRGGTQRAAVNYSLGYARAGYHVAVFGYDGGGPRSLTLKQHGIKVFELDRHTPEAYERIEKWNPDLIHIHRTGYPDKATGEVISRLKKPKGRNRPVLETNVFARADHTPAGKLIDVHLHLSEWCLWKWSKWARGMRPSPLGVVIPYAVDPTHFFHDPEGRRSFRQAHDIPEHAIVFGRVGQRSVWKWSTAMFDAFEQAASTHSTIYLVVVGLPEELRSRMNALPASIRERVREVGYLDGDDKLRACYSSFDAFLHTAEIGESFGMVLAEAMLCACPVITQSRPLRDNSQLEVVQHGIGGLVAANTEGLVGSMNQFIEDGALRRSMGQAGAQSIRERFALPVVMKNLTRIVEVIRGAASSPSLRQQLELDPMLTTTVPDSRIKQLLSHALGDSSLRESLLLPLVHNPLAYRAWQAIKRANE